MVLIGAITWVRGVLLFITQVVGGIVAAYIVQVLFQGELAVSTTLGGGTTIAQGVVIEMILTAQLVFTIFMLAAEKHTGNFIAPVGIGLSLFVAELTGQSFGFCSFPIMHLFSPNGRPKTTNAHRMLVADNIQEYSGPEAP
jgi:aquaporin related protein